MREKFIRCSVCREKFIRSNTCHQISADIQLFTSKSITKRRTSWSFSLIVKYCQLKPNVNSSDIIYMQYWQSNFTKFFEIFWEKKTMMLCWIAKILDATQCDFNCSLHRHGKMIILDVGASVFNPSHSLLGLEERIVLVLIRYKFYIHKRWL